MPGVPDETARWARVRPGDRDVGEVECVVKRITAKLTPRLRSSRLAVSEVLV